MRFATHIFLVTLVVLHSASAADGGKTWTQFPDEETATEQDHLVILPRVLAEVWASPDLKAALSLASPAPIGTAMQLWDEYPQPVSPDMAIRLNRVADIYMPLARRNDKVKPSQEDMWNHARSWWRLTTRDWMVAQKWSDWTPEQIDQLVLGQLDGSAPVRLFPSDETLLELVGRTTGAYGSKLQDFIKNAEYWIQAQMFDDLVLALWRAHPALRPASSSAWMDLHLRPATGMLAYFGLGMLSVEGGQDNISVIDEFILDAMKRIPVTAATELGFALFRATPERPAVVDPQTALAWVRKQQKDWLPETTLNFFQRWLLGSQFFASPTNREPGDPMSIGRHADEIRALFREAILSYAASGRAGRNVSGSDVIQEVESRLNRYAAAWAATQAVGGDKP